MTEMIAVAKLLAHHGGTAQRITRKRSFPISRNPLVLIPIAMAGEFPGLFGLGVGDGQKPIQIFLCANPVNRDEQYAMLGAAMAAIEPTILSWQANDELPQIIVTGGDSGRAVLGFVDRTVYSHRADLSTAGRQLAWFDKRSDCPDSACLLVLPTALSQCFATGQDEFADQHLGAFLEWCAPADGRVWERVTKAEQLPASAATDPEFDRKHLEPAVDGYAAAVRDNDPRGAARFKAAVHGLISDEIKRRYRLAVAALRLLRTLPEAEVAAEIVEQDRASFLDHLNYVADPTNLLSRGLQRDMQTAEFMTREFSVDRINGLDVREAGSAYAIARLSGDLLEGEVINIERRKLGRRLIVVQTFASDQQLSLRSGDKLSLLNDDRFGYRIEEISTCPTTGRTLVKAEVTRGKTLPDLPKVGGIEALAPPLRDREGLKRARIIAWERMKGRPTPVPATSPLVVKQDLARVVAGLKGKK